MNLEQPDHCENFVFPEHCTGFCSECNFYVQYEIQDTQDFFEKFQDINLLMHLLSSLSEKELQVIELLYFDEYNLSQIEKSMHIARRTIHKLTDSAIEKMRAINDF